MSKFLILCPTYDHADTLLMSVSSVRGQTVTDWEMVVICDGAPERTREVMEALRAQDDRISYVWMPKSARYGEEYRDTVIRASDATYVCHIGDDDLWAPDHLATHEVLLERGEWTNTGTVGFRPPGPLLWRFNNAAPRRKNFHPHSIGLNNIGYHRAAYMRLAVGWTAPPKSTMPSDIYMWSKFFTDPGLTVASTAHPTVLKFWSRIGNRRDLSATERAAELGVYLARCGTPDYITGLRQQGDVTGPLLRMFHTYDCVGERRIEGAAAKCGLAFVPPDAASAPSRSSATAMQVPLTSDQREQAEFALLSLRAVLARDTNAQRDREIWKARVLTDKPAGVRMFKYLCTIARRETYYMLEEMAGTQVLPNKLDLLKHKLKAAVAGR